MRKADLAMAVISITLIISSSSHAGEWAIAYGGSGSDSAFSIREISDSGYVAAGYTWSFGLGKSDYWVMKLNGDGTVAWQKTYGGNDEDVAHSIHETSDDGYMVAGRTKSFGAGDYDFWVMKLNKNGTVEWQKTYGGSRWDAAFSIHETLDDGYVVAGETFSFALGESGYWVMKLNGDGTVEWQKTYGGSDFNETRSIHETSDGGYVVAGYTNSFGAGDYDFWVMKLNRNGTVEWQKTYGGSKEDYAWSIHETSNGGYVVAGYTNSFGAGNYDFWVMKLNRNGTVEWQKTYGGSKDDCAWSIHETSDGGYVVAGFTLSFGLGKSNYWVMKLNGDGTVAWQKTYGGNDADRAYSIHETSDGGCVLAGYTLSFGAGRYDSWVVKLNSDGEIPGCELGSDSNAIVTDTGAVITNTNVSPVSTDAIVTETNVIEQNTSAVVTVICTGVIELAKDLLADWNLISFPLQPSDTNIKKVLETLEGKYDSFWRYEANPGWSWFLPDNELASNLWTAEAGIGYWIHMLEEGELVIRGEQPDTAIELALDWNLVGYCDDEHRAIGECMSSGDGNYTSVWEFDPVLGWRWYLPDSDLTSNLWQMRPWFGYWVEVINEFNWDIK